MLNCISKLDSIAMSLSRDSCAAWPRKAVSNFTEAVGMKIEIKDSKGSINAGNLRRQKTASKRRGANEKKTQNSALSNGDV